MEAELIAALTGFTTVAGGGVAFIWNKVEKRFTHIEHELEKCRLRETIGQEREAVRLTVIELLYQEVMRHSADSPVLKRVETLLDRLKKINAAGENV